MRILLVIDYYQPQLGYSESCLVKELVQQGHQVAVLTSNYYYPFPDYQQTAGKLMGDRELKPGIKEENGVLLIREELKFEIFSRAFMGGQERSLKLFKPELVIVNGVLTFNNLMMARLKNKYKFKLVCFDSHLPSEFNREKILLKQIIYFVFRNLFSFYINNKVDKFIAVQEETINIMKQFYGIKKEIDFVPLGTDTHLNQFDEESKIILRKEYSIAIKNFVVLYTGKIIPAKGVDILFKAFNILGSRHEDVNLMLVGDGKEDYKKACVELLAEKHREKVIWVPFQPCENLYKYYSLADVGVWPLQESTAMNDAISCSLPIIANHNIGTKLRVSNSNALLYKEYDFEDLVNKIEQLYQNPKLLKAMGINGRKLATTELSWSVLANQYLLVN